jgi:hypothetical protein
MRIKRILLLLSFLNISSIGFSQKETKFFDQNDKEISERKLYKIQKKNNSDLIYGTIESENFIETRIVQRKVDGYLDKQQKLEVINFLEGLTENKIPKKYTIVTLFKTNLEFYKAFDKFNSQQLKNREHYYRITILDKEEIIQVNIYETEEDFLKHFGNDKILTSKNHVIEDIFFKMRYPGGGYAVVNYHGKFASYFGEFHSSQVIQDVNFIEHSK